MCFCTIYQLLFDVVKWWLYQSVWFIFISAAASFYVCVTCIGDRVIMFVGRCCVCPEAVTRHCHHDVNLWHVCRHRPAETVIVIIIIIITDWIYDVYYFMHPILAAAAGGCTAVIQDLICVSLRPSVRPFICTWFTIAAIVTSTGSARRHLVNAVKTSQVPSSVAAVVLLWLLHGL